MCNEFLKGILSGDGARFARLGGRAVGRRRSSLRLRGAVVKHGLVAFQNSKLQTSNFKLQIPNLNIQISNYKFQIPNSKIQIPNSKIQIPNSRPPDHQTTRPPDHQFQALHCIIIRILVQTTRPPALPTRKSLGSANGGN